MGQAVSARLEAIRALGGPLPPVEVFKRLSSAYPDLTWIAVANTAGEVLASAASETSSDHLRSGDNVSTTSWFSQPERGAPSR